jgi:hypothetical protein
MEKNTSSGFRTKSGICTITPEEISFARPDPTARGSSRTSPLAVLFASLFFGFGVFLILFGETLIGVIWVILGLALRWQQVRGNAAVHAPTIPRQAVRKIETHAPLWLLMPGYFVVWLEMGGKMFRQRIIVQGGKGEYLRAVELMRAAGLLQS